MKSLVLLCLLSISVLNKKGLQDSQPKKIFQDEVDSVISESFQKGKMVDLEHFQKGIEGDKGMNTHQKRYWKTYLQYYKALIYKKLKQEDRAEHAIDSAVSFLQDNLMGSEEYALLAACKSLSMPYANVISLASLSSEVKSLARKALKMNPDNLRAYYVLCSQNFHTPKMFGGMARVEEYAIEGLKCPNSLHPESRYAPRWGRPLIYRILIEFYKGEKNKAKMLEYKRRAEREFPDKFQK